MKLPPEIKSSLQRHFPTLFVALPRAPRSLSGAFLVVLKRFRRSTTRNRRIAVAVVGFILGSVLVRSLLFWRLADYHNSQVVGVEYKIVMLKPSRLCVEVWFDTQGSEVSPRQVLKYQWHRHLYYKYSGAAARPWLPVEPDPPPPGTKRISLYLDEDYGDEACE